MDIKTIFILCASLADLSLAENKLNSGNKTYCSDFFPGKYMWSELQYKYVTPINNFFYLNFWYKIIRVFFSCTEVRRCSDGRWLGLEIIPEDSSQSLTDLIKKAQNATCPEDGFICCGTKYILPSGPKIVQNISLLEDLLFKTPKSEIGNQFERKTDNSAENPDKILPKNTDENSSINCNLSLIILILPLLNCFTYKSFLYLIIWYITR